jgi:hypothetical protein
MFQHETLQARRNPSIWAAPQAQQMEGSPRLIISTWLAHTLISLCVSCTAHPFYHDYASGCVVGEDAHHKQDIQFISYLHFGE